MSLTCEFLSDNDEFNSMACNPSDHMNILFSSGTTLNQIHAGIDDIDIIQTMLDSCDIIFATHYVYDILIEKIPESKKIHRVDLDIDTQNFEYILSILGKEPPMIQSKRM